MSTDLEVFENNLDNYRWVVEHVIPRATWREDPDVTDEIPLLLFTRDELRQALQEAPAQFASFLDQIRKLDESLLQQRHAVLEIPWYAQARRGKHKPKAAWWWCLDELPERQCLHCHGAMTLKRRTVTLGRDGLAPEGELLVYICPQCGEKHLPRLSLEILMELINQAFEPVLAQPRLLPEDDVPELAIVG